MNAFERAQQLFAQLTQSGSNIAGRLGAGIQNVAQDFQTRPIVGGLVGQGFSSAGNAMQNIPQQINTSLFQPTIQSPVPNSMVPNPGLITNIGRSLGQGELNLERNMPVYGQLQRGIRSTVAPIMRNFVGQDTVDQYKGFSQPEQPGILPAATRFVGEQVPYIPLMMATEGVTNPVTSRVGSLVPEGTSLAGKVVSGAAKGAIQFAPYSWMGALDYAKTPQERVQNIENSAVSNITLGGVLGGTGGALSYGVGQVGKALQGAFPKATPEEAQQVSGQFLRDVQTGQFIPKTPQNLKESVQDWVRTAVGKKPGEPVFHSDLMQALGDQRGFIKPDEFVPKGNSAETGFSPLTASIDEQTNLLKNAKPGTGEFKVGEIYTQDVAGGPRPVVISKVNPDGSVEGFYAGAISPTEKSFGISPNSLQAAKWTDPARELQVPQAAQAGLYDTGKILPQHNKFYTAQANVNANGERITNFVEQPKAKLVQIDPSLETFIHKDERGWTVTEARTGTSISRSMPTQEAAIQNAKENIVNIPKRDGKTIQQFIEDQLNKYGGTPRYQNRPSNVSIVNQLQKQGKTQEAQQIIDQQTGLSKKLMEAQSRVAQPTLGEQLNQTPERAKMSQKAMQEGITTPRTGRDISVSPQAEIRFKGNLEPLPWEQSGYKAQEPSTTIPTDIATQQRVSATEGGITGKPSDETQKAFADWVNARRATKLEQLVKQKEFSDLNSRGIQGIFDFQSGDKIGRLADVKKYFDSKYQQVKDAGIDLNYKQDYLPQLWANTPEEVQQVFGRSLGTKPSFTMESIIKNYQDGIKAGLTPRFNNISDLAGWYERTANKAIADKGFFDYLGKNGFITPAGKAPRDWVTLNPDKFPKVKVSTAEGSYSGIFKSPPELAQMINNYLGNPNGTLESIANFVSNSKNRLLSFGVSVPGARTAINAHGFNILARNTMANPTDIKQLFRGVAYMLNPKAGERYFNANLPEAVAAAKDGLTLSTNEYKSALENETLRSKIGQAWNENFEKPLFEQMIPALKLQYYQKLVKSGMKGADAAHVTNDFFGGFNWEELGKSKDWQNAARIAFLAPDWLRTNVRLAGKIPQAFLQPNSPGAKAYRTFAGGLMATYAISNIINKTTSGHWMYQNDPGHTFEIETGYTNDGQKRYFKPYGTAADFARIPVDVALGLAQGDPSVIARTIRNRLSTILGPAVGLLTNTNYKGQSIYGKDRYGQPMPLGQQIGGVAGELGTTVGFPSFLSNFIDYATGKQGGEQALTQATELPFRYSGGAYSKTQKEIANIAQNQGIQGKDLYDLNKQTQGQSFSKNQMGLIQQKLGNLSNILQNRQETQKDNQIKKNVGISGVTQQSGSKIFYTENGQVKTLNFAPLTPPVLSGQTELDKVRLSHYSSAITTQITNIAKAVDLGKLTPQQGEELITSLKQKQDAIKVRTAKPKVTRGRVRTAGIRGPRPSIRRRTFRVKARVAKSPKLLTARVKKAPKVKYKLSSSIPHYPQRRLHA